jgi:cellulose synthase/poly-beta-1,6-N-acetylglucosamine synthase-like glycosyltransferase
MHISVGICAYNEEENIAELLGSFLKQEVCQVMVREIIVVSDGSNDRTDAIVESFMSDGPIRLIKLRERLGKFVAINEFLKIAQSPLLVLCSADVRLADDALERLCAPFLSDEKLGMAAGRSVCVNPKETFMGYAANFYMDLRHRIALLQPKFSALIAFKKVIDRLPPTIVDEEQVACAVAEKGYGLKYVPESIFYEKGPESLRELIEQRRRYHLGHLLLERQTHYKAATLKAGLLLRSLLSGLSGAKKRRWLYLSGAIFLEMIVRLLARSDILFKREVRYYRWPIAKSTKALGVS